MTIKQMILAATILGITGNNLLAEEKLPTVFLLKQPMVMVNHPHKVTEIYPDYDITITHYEKTISCEVPDHNEETLKEFGGRLINTWNDYNLFFMTDAGKEQIQNMDMDCTIGQLTFAELSHNWKGDKHNWQEIINHTKTHTRTVRILHPKDLKSPVSSLNRAINNLRHTGATAENIHDALNATIE